MFRPNFLPSTEEQEFIDLLLSSAWNDMPRDPSQWTNQYLRNVATVTLDYFNLLGGIPPLDPEISYTTSDPLTCADGNTIWSQRGQSYTQWVDLDQVDSSKSILPPGSFEGPGGRWQTELLLWELGELKDAPLSLDRVKEQAVMAITLTY